jgi:hypothetical protein
MLFVMQCKGFLKYIFSLSISTKNLLTFTRGDCRLDSNEGFVYDYKIFQKVHIQAGHR